MIRKSGRVRRMREVLKKTVCCLMSAGLIVTAVPMSVLYGESLIVYAETLFTYTEGNTTYTCVSMPNSDGGREVVIDEWSSTDTAITIPSEINGMEVVGISYGSRKTNSTLTEVTIPASVRHINRDAFYMCEGLKSIIVDENNTEYMSIDGILYKRNAEAGNAESLIKCPVAIDKDELTVPDGVKSIEKWAFSSCVGIKNIKLPNSLTEIGEGTFSGCNGLAGINIPAGVTVIGNSAFSGCSKLTEINIPAGVTSIGAYTFYNCSMLTEINIPESVISIGENAFSYCKGITSIDIPAKVESIGNKAFDGSVNLISINVDELNKYYKSVNGMLFDTNGTLIECPDGKKEVILPDDVVVIGDFAFENCNNITNITIPASVTSIGADSFDYCNRLKEINVEEGNEYYKSSSGLLCDINGTLLIVPRGLKKVNVQGDVTSISTESFRGIRNADVIISESVQEIEEYAFSNSYYLNIVILSDTVVIEPKAIGYNKYKGLNGITIYARGGSTAEAYAKENGVDFGVLIGNSGYTYEENSTGITITKYMGDEADVTIPSEIGGKKVTAIGQDVFSECDSLINVNIPEGVTTIGNLSFRDCNNLISVKFPESLVEMGSSVFIGCESLVNIMVEAGNEWYESVDGILYNKVRRSLMQCPAGKETATIQNGTVMIEWEAFEGCEKLNDIAIPFGVEVIGHSAFMDCINLKHVNVPDSVREIYDRALGFKYVDVNGKLQLVKIEGFMITGSVGSAAEKYAQDNGFEFTALQNAVSSDGIEINYEEDVLNQDVQLDSGVLTDGDEEYDRINISDKIIDSSVSPEDVVFSAYDISLVNNLNQKVQPNGSLTVKMPVPTGYDGNRCKVYRVNEDGSFTDMEAVYIGTHMIFETNHFSTYMITETELESNKASDVIYGDANSDGTVNSKDAVMLKKHLAGYKDLGINTDACDVNADGEVNSKDAVLILKKLAGYDVELGK